MTDQWRGGQAVFAVAGVSQGDRQQEGQGGSQTGTVQHSSADISRSQWMRQDRQTSRQEAGHRQLPWELRSAKLPLDPLWRESQGMWGAPGGRFTAPSSSVAAGGRLGAEALRGTMTRVSGDAAAIKTWPCPRTSCCRRHPFRRKVDAHPSQEEHLCPALSLSQTQELESLSLSLLLMNHSTAAHPGSCSKQCPRSNHLLPHCQLLGRDVRTWTTGPGGSSAVEGPLTRSPRPLEWGSYSMEE